MFHQSSQENIRKSIVFTSAVGFCPDKFPISTAKVLLDAVGYVCSESLKSDDCFLRVMSVMS